MKILVDMNLPIEWEAFLKEAGWEAVHCSRLENRPVKDKDLMAWARDHQHVLFTNDLGFGTILELASERGPSVFQIIARDIMVPQVGASTVRSMRQFEEQLEQGAMVLVDMETGRARVFRVGEKIVAPAED